MNRAAVPGFVCEVLHTRLTPSSCAKRHTAGEDPSCRRCPVGAAHGKGDTPTHWPAVRGGKPIVRLEVIAFSRRRTRMKRTA